MPRDLKSITHDLNEVVQDIAAYRRAGFSTDEAVERFHALVAEQKCARRAEAVWHVYFMHAPDAKLVKIGVTSNLNVRLLALQNSSPVPLALLGCAEGDKATERALHAQWGHIRSHGEWFLATEELLSSIRSLCA